jgi:hypothetical protein
MSGRFSVFRADVRSAELRPPGSYLVSALQAELGAERLPLDTFGSPQPDDVRVAGTASRSMLGLMNQMTVEIRYQVMRSDDARNCDIDAINYQLCRTLRHRGGYVRPIDLIASQCAPAAPRRSRRAPERCLLMHHGCRRARPG